MNIPFTQAQFLETFARYNREIWPAQFLGVFICLGLAIACLSKRGARARIALFFFGGLWIWNGVVYQIGFFSAINPVAKVFGAFFVLQGLLFVWAGLKSKSVFAALAGWQGIVGLAMVLYAAAVYPILGWLGGHGYPFAPVLGAAPCPTTIFTLGLLLMARPAIPRWLFAIPILWGAVATSAAVKLGIREDFGLGVSAAAALVLILLPVQGSVVKMRSNGIGAPAAPRSI